MTGQRRGVCVLGAAAVMLRVFVMTVLDEPYLLNAGWLSALCGGAMGMIALLPCLFEGRSGRGGFETLSSGAGRISALLIAPVLVYDAAAVMRLLSGLAAYSAMSSFPLYALYLPIVGAALLFCLMGPGALTGTAIIWRKLGVALGVILLATQLGDMEPSNLVPLLGPGVPLLFEGAWRAAGLTASLVLAAYVMMGPRVKGKAAFPAALVGALIIGVLGAAAFSMLVPAMPSGPATRLFRMEALMDNGLSGLSMDLVYVLLLEGGLVLTACFETMGAAACLMRAFSSGRAALDRPDTCGKVIAIAVCALETALIAFNLAGRAAMLVVSAWYYPLALAAAALAAAGVLRTKKSAQ